MNEHRDELIERYRAGRATLRDAVAAHPEPSVGGLDGRQVLIHVIGWDREVASSLPLRAAGHGVPDYADREAWDERFATRMEGLTLDALLAEYAASEDEVVRVLLGLPDEAFEDGAAGTAWGAEWADHALDHAAAFGDIGA